MVALEAGQLDELEHVLDPCVPLRAAPARARVAARCSSPPSASRRERRPGRRCRIVVAPRALGGLAVDLDGAGRRFDQVADDPQQRGLAATGRADQGNELAGLDVEVDALQRRHSGLELLRDALDRNCASREVLRGALQDEPFQDHDCEEEDDAEQRADDDRRPQVRRLDRVVLVEVHDRVAETALERRGVSPMIAPITLAVAEILSAEKT